MPTNIVIVITLSIVFILIYIILEGLLQYIVQRRTLRNRLGYIEQAQETNEVNSHNSKLYRQIIKHLSHLMHSLRLPIRGEYLFQLHLLLLLSGFVIGYLFFHAVPEALLLGVMLTASPYVVLRMLLVHRRLEAQIDFLPALEAFYQCYVLTGERQIKVALSRLIEEKQMTGTMKKVFEQLYRNLTVMDSEEESLELFAHALGHIWADYFVQMLKVSITEGVSISTSLRQLIADMRAARRANEQERHRLLEIRIANFTPILFLALFVGINMYYNREQSIHYYLHDKGGREMILQMLTMIFLSFLMGLYLSRKKLN